MIDKSRYPAWNAISRARRESAGQKCEWCGAPNHAIIVRKRGTPDYLIEDMDDDCLYKWPDGRWIKLSELPEGYDYDKSVKVVLTVHHIGVPYPDGRPGDPHDKMDVRPENLVALCQRCHLLADLPIHMQHAKETRRKKKQEKVLQTGQRSLFGDAS